MLQNRGLFMKKFGFILLSVLILITSCKTIDIEKSEDLEEEKKEVVLPEVPVVKENEYDVNGIRIKESEFVYDLEPVIIEKKEYIVIDKAEYEKNLKERPTGQAAVKQSLKDSFVTLENFVGGTSIYDYDENRQFPVFTKQLSLTTILLNNDEQMPEGSVPFMSDTERWEITGDIWESDEGSRQLVMIKPKSAGLETNMMIVTNKRIYHFVLYSTKTDYQPMVKFTYPAEKKFITSKTKKVFPESIKTSYDTTDASLISFNYKVTVPVGSSKVEWIPNRVYDDGSHTYILLPEVVLQKEFPAVWENNRDIVNYEIDPEIHNLIIINKLVNKVTLRVGHKKVVITKKKGTPKVMNIKR